MCDIGELTARLRNALSGYGVENAGFEAQQLMLKAGIPKDKVLWEPHEAADTECEERAMRLLERRLSGYPLQYLIGDWDFYACTFKVGEGVLIPRQDTETLAELADGFLKKRPPRQRRVLDLCAGSGCIGLSLARFCGAEVTCVEKSERAFEYLEENAAEYGAKTILGDIFDEEIMTGLGGAYDLIVSNPPYLTESDMRVLQKEVTFEPREALFGGADGLDFYRGITRIYPGKLTSGGMLAVEIGMGQEDNVCGMFRENGVEPHTLNDLRGVCRVVYGTVT